MLAEALEGSAATVRGTSPSDSYARSLNLGTLTPRSASTDSPSGSLSLSGAADASAGNGCVFRAALAATRDDAECNAP
jgi:hypothetical protein